MAKTEDFRDKILMTVVDAMYAARDNPMAQADVVEALASSLGRSIAMMSLGQQEIMSRLLEGAVHYAHEEAADFQKAGKFLGDAKNWAQRSHG